MKVIMYEATFSLTIKTWERDEIKPSRDEVHGNRLHIGNLPIFERTISEKSEYNSCEFATKQKAINYINEQLSMLTKHSYSRGKLKTEDGNIDFTVDGVSVWGEVRKKTITIPEENIKEEMR